MLMQLTALRTFVSDILRQQKYVRACLEPELQSLEQQWGTSFDAYLRKKMTRYYGLLTTGVLAESYCRLHARPLLAPAREISSALGAMTPIFDDFFDRNLLTDAEIRQMMAAPSGFPARTLEQGAIIHFHEKILRALKAPDSFRERIEKVFQAQIDSRQQSREDITEEALWKITYDKAGYSLQAYREILDLPDAEGEQEVYYQLGGILQLCNDTFDIYKDLGEGIMTLPIRFKDFERLKAVYLRETQDWIARCRKLSFRQKDIERFIAFMLIVICRGLVALEQLEALEKRKGKGFNLRECNRKELICDMAKPRSFLRSLVWASRLRRTTH